jgi:hypothetical protein
MDALRLAYGLVAVLALASWNAAVTRVAGNDTAGPIEAAVDPAVVEHERNWYDYLRGFDAHHGDVDGSHPEHGSVRRGLELWLASGCPRGYTRGDHTYVCANAPRVLRVHQAGHAPAFGGEFDPLRTVRRPDGGLADEPLRTLDVMLPGAVPHTLLRLRDPRGLGETYDAWLRDGRIVRR